MSPPAFKLGRVGVFEMLALSATESAVSQEQVVERLVASHTHQEATYSKVGRTILDREAFPLNDAIFCPVRQIQTVRKYADVYGRRHWLSPPPDVLLAFNEPTVTGQMVCVQGEDMVKRVTDQTGRPLAVSMNVMFQHLHSPIIAL
jgi:hypothetical protein